MLAEVSDVSAARTKRTGKLVVVGDGPSLESFDFKRLAGVDTLAVKAAIRHLDRTDWRPTHYACLDDAFIDVHHDAIARLMAEGAVETAFLTGRYLDHHPEAVRDPRLVILGRLEAFEESVFFRSADPSRATGRANCVRYGALLGYDKIALIGFDLIPDPPGSRDHAIENASFNMLRDDFLREGVRSAVYNADPHSFLSTGAVLPYKSLAQFLGEPALSSVIVPATAGERAQILDNIWLWSQPAFFPLLGTASERAPLLVFVFNNDEAAKMQSEIEAALNASPLLGRCFSGVRYVNLQLTGDADRYERDNARIAGVEGRRAGPNNMFFGGLAAVADLPGYTLWLETDCVPLRAD
ncbi:MAG TPA: hypothetical protein VNH64_02665, partial [Parvularculaceae bacterium]|nr:hypothetical protein [Parvularculaceae bacterium]